MTLIQKTIWAFGVALFMYLFIETTVSDVKDQHPITTSDLQEYVEYCKSDSTRNFHQIQSIEEFIQWKKHR